MDDASTARTRRAASSLSGTHTDISFNAFDEAYMIRVKPNNALIPQRGLFAEYIDANGDVTRRIEVEGGCHFVGNVISHEVENNTLSALNLCNGIVSLEICLHLIIYFLGGVGWGGDGVGGRAVIMLTL